MPFPLLFPPSLSPSSLQVERRVVNQLASAFEQQQLTRGSEVRLVVEAGERGEPAIKLVVTGKSTVPSVPVGHLSSGQRIARQELVF